MGGGERDSSAGVSTLEVTDLVDDADYSAVQEQGCSVIGMSSAATTSFKEGTGGAGIEKERVSGSIGGGDEYEVVYTKENVSVHPTQHANERINGRLRLIKQGPSLFMTWIPYIHGASSNDGRNRTISSKNSERDRNLYTIRAVSLAEMRSIRRHTPTLGWQYVIIVLTSGLAFPPLYFHNGGVRVFLATLRAHAILVRSADDANVYLVNDIQDPLQKSLASLELTETPDSAAVSRDEPPTILPSAEPVENKGCNEENGSRVAPLAKSEVKVPKDAARDISLQVLEKFSLVTKFARETTAHIFGDGRILGGIDGLDADRGPLPRLQRASTTPVLSTQVENDPQDLSAVSYSADLDERNGAERKKAEEEATTNVGTFELVDGTQVLRSRSSSLSFGVLDNAFPVPNESPALVWGRARPPPLGSEEWTSFMDSEGRVTDPKALRKRIFHGGVEGQLRREVWKFLLGHYDFDSTYAEREFRVAMKREEYQILKTQWQTVSEEQAKRFAKFRERKHRVEKDVVRTDRVLPFYAGDDNPNVDLLQDVLVTYSFYNFDLGYCQGMSDLLSPILYVMEDESESFWCFAALMERMAPNFHRDQNGMHSQLLALSKFFVDLRSGLLLLGFDDREHTKSFGRRPESPLVQLLDGPLHDYFKQADCLNYFFCFRWILIQFKREFEYENVLRLWEVLWSRHLSEHFHLYICVAILKRHRRRIMDEQMEFDSLLKFINELGGKIPLESTLRDAEALCLFAGDTGAACIHPGGSPAFCV